LTSSNRRQAAWLLGLFYLAYFALVGVYVIFLPKMLVQSGYSATQVGMIFAASPLMRFILPFVFRRIGAVERLHYLAALILTFLSALLFFATLHSFTAFFLANLLYGAAMGIVLPYVDTIALQIVSKERYGRVRLWGSIGFMAIALWLGRVLETPLQSLVYLAILALATLLAGWLLARYDRSEPREEAQDPQDAGSFSLRRYWAFWLSAFLLQVSFGGFYNFFTIYETAHGISLEMTSWLWSFGVLCEIAMLYWQGPLLKNRPLLHLIEFSVATTVLRWMILWLWPDSLAAAFAAQSLHAFNFALYYTAAIAYIYKLYTQKKLAQQFFLGMTFGLGGSVGAILAGWVYERAPEQLFLFEALAALAAWGAIRIHRRRKGHNAPAR
jgi:PPP family 3-phenylpropionic acid transporter